MYLNNELAKDVRVRMLMVCVCVFQDDLESGEEVATCPSCSLIVRVVYDKVRASAVAAASFWLLTSPLLPRRPSCAENSSKLQLLLLEGSWSRSSPESFSSSPDYRQMNA